MKRLAVAVGILLALQAQAAEQWDFEVLLDGKSIGSHRFTLESRGDERVLRSQASFDVKLLFITAYRYRHDATERWQGDCLVGLKASTDDNGTVGSVAAARDGNRLQVDSPKGHSVLDGCVMSFAYWNPAMLKQARLLNAQTGKYQPVQITALPDQPLRVRGQEVQAQHYRLTGPEQPVELWYSAQGDWLGLESRVAGQRRLLYRHR